MAAYLAFKELWRNRGRYLLFSLVIALITLLVLFIAALAGGLANANRQFLDELDADLLVFQENVDLSTTASRLGQSRLADVRRLPGVADVGPLGFASATLIYPVSGEPVDVALVGVEPGRPGDPALIDGPGLVARRASSAVIDAGVASRSGLRVGDRLALKTIQGTEEEIFQLEVVGLTSERQYFYQPAIIVPLATWDKIRPQAQGENGGAEVVANLFAVTLEDPARAAEMQAAIQTAVDGVEVTDKITAILALPGYSAQQSTLNTQQAFTLLIGILVVGGFFQIQTLQKVAQIGVLKAIGSASRSVAGAILIQITTVTVLGVAIGGLATLMLALLMPGNIPIQFTGPTVFGAIGLLLLIGPLGGLVSVRLAVRIDPLTAIGLSN